MFLAYVTESSRVPRRSYGNNEACSSFPFPLLEKVKPADDQAKLFSVRERPRRSTNDTFFIVPSSRVALLTGPLRFQDDRWKGSFQSSLVVDGNDRNESEVENTDKKRFFSFNFVGIKPYRRRTLYYFSL